MVRALAGDQLVRVYSGFYNGNNIELEADRQSKEVAAASKMSVRLRKTDSLSLEGHREIIRDGKNGILVDTSNLVLNLTKELVELSKNKEMRDAYSKEAIATITEKYNAENMTREIEREYKKLLNIF